MSRYNAPVPYRLATLLIVAAIVCAALTGIWFYSPQAAIVLACVGLLVVFLPAALLMLIVWRELGQAERDLRAAGPAAAPPVGGNEDAAGKRPGQFGISTLFVLITVAAIACAIVRLPIHPVGIIFSLTAVWICFSIWAMGKPDQRQWASLAYRRRLAVLNAVGSFVVLAPWVLFEFQRAVRPVLFADVAFGALMLLSPAHAIWQAGKAVRAELSQSRQQKLNEP
jgi:hypothetical protein